MRHIVERADFKRRKRRIDKSGQYRKVMATRYLHALKTLASDGELDYTYRDHALTGDKEGYRECHLAFDLVLLYTYEGDDLLVLETIGSHDEVLGV